MKSIFLSRPTWVDTKYERGLEGFLNVLKSHDLDPRTIGSTDSPIKSPMDEVINLMGKCMGTIVLGYPQITIESGLIKNNEIKKTFSLSTEWNHIEAALAHSSGHPLLVIHDKSVVRGIFDRGVLNTFLYSLNLSDPTWPLRPEISGALKTWISVLPNTTKLNRGVVDKNEGEKPTLKWGCYKFEGKEGLYCPACYETKGQMIPASRLRGGHYKCPACKADLS